MEDNTEYEKKVRAELEQKHADTKARVVAEFKQRVDVNAYNGIDKQSLFNDFVVEKLVRLEVVVLDLVDQEVNRGQPS